VAFFFKSGVITCYVLVSRMGARHSICNLIFFCSKHSGFSRTLAVLRLEHDGQIFGQESLIQCCLMRSATLAEAARVQARPIHRLCGGVIEKDGRSTSRTLRGWQPLNVNQPLETAFWNGKPVNSSMTRTASGSFEIRRLDPRR
jgi:hypothetical protein